MLDVTTERLNALWAACGDAHSLKLEIGRGSARDEIRACIRAVIAVRELAAEMAADDAVTAAAIEGAKVEGPKHYLHELIGAKRDTRAWRMKLTAIVGRTP